MTTTAPSPASNAYPSHRPATIPLFPYITYYIGIFLVFLTHFYMLAYMPEMRTHAIINLVAALLIAHYFMHSEGYITWRM